MKIRLDDIPDEGLQVEIDREDLLVTGGSSNAPIGDEIVFQPDLTGRIQITPTEDEFFLTGRAETTMTLQCARCLTPFSQNVGIEMEVVVKRRAGDQVVEEEEFADKDAASYYTTDDQIELKELLVQEFLLEAPVKPLCREDCPGFCPRCGSVKGSDDCRCPTETRVDPRWEALAKLKEEIGP